MSEIEWLENWYKQNCDGIWEHSYGIEIGTLDNPGWYVRIDLSETRYEGLVIPVVNMDQDEENWIRCGIENKTFKGCGDTHKLNKIIRIFRQAIENFNTDTI